MPILKQPEINGAWELTFRGEEILALRRGLLGYSAEVTSVTWQMLDCVKRMMGTVVDGVVLNADEEPDESLEELAANDEDEAEGLDRPRLCSICKLDLLKHLPGSLACIDGGQPLGSFYTPAMALLPAVQPVMMVARLKEGVEA